MKDRNIMKLFNIQLSDWYGAGQQNCIHNFWRSYEDEHFKSYVGLIVCPNVETFKEDPRKCCWKFTFIGNRFAFLLDKYQKSYGNKEYQYDEIPQAKKDIDKFLISMNKLLAFI